jgi:four helix bundle protein
MRDYTKIEAWPPARLPARRSIRLGERVLRLGEKLADDLTVAVYERTRKFPKEEVYGLTSQLRRASYSVPANIVEGSSRESKKDYLHFLYIARGSLSETQYFIHLARRLGYLSFQEAEALHIQTKSTFGCLHGLIKSVEKEAASGSVESTARRGKLGKAVATITSLLAIGLIRWSTGQLSVVS